MSSYTTLFKGRWIEFNQRVFRTHDGERHAWEFVSRVNRPAACAIVPWIAGEPPRILLIRQYRPSIQQEVIEFPAGLVDEGEDIEQSARRELREETGREGHVLSVSPPLFTSAGLTDETLHFVEVEVAGEPRETALEPSENIEPFEVVASQLLEELGRLASEGFALDAKLWFYAQGLHAQRRDRED